MEKYQVAVFRGLPRNGATRATNFRFGCVSAGSGQLAAVADGTHSCLEVCAHARHMHKHVRICDILHKHHICFATHAQANVPAPRA